MGDLLDELLARYGEPPTWPDIDLLDRPRREGPRLGTLTVPPRLFGNPVAGHIGTPEGEPDPETDWRVTRPYADGSLPQYGPHDGLDLGRGTSHADILAMDDGEVYQSFFDAASGGAGIIRIDHGGGWTTGYAHMDQLWVTVGTRVTRGQGIGRMDSTGWVSGAHLHFDTTYQAEGRTDPWPLLEQNAMTILPGYQDRIDNRQTRTTDVANFRAAPDTSSDPIGQLPDGSLIIPIARCKGQAIGSAADKTDWYANIKTTVPGYGDEAILGYLHSSVLTRTTDGKGVKLDPIESSGASQAEVDEAERKAADAVRDAGVSALNTKAKEYGA